MTLEPALSPRNLVTLMVLIIARISTVHQDPRSLADQIALCEKYVRRRYSGPVKFVHITGQSSGEVLDREDLVKAEAAVDSGRFDLVVVEDLSRICRRNRAFDFCEACEDVGTRLIAVSEPIDTARADWRLNAFFATFRHEIANKDTGDRIKRTQVSRFMDGGIVQTFPYGYVKAAGAKSDADVTRLPEAERVWDEVFRRLEDGAGFCETADWLNAEGVPTGEWARTDRWTGPMLSKVVRNPILKGYRRRNERVSKRVNKTGKRRSVKAPAGDLLLRHAPHLQFIEPARYDRVIALLNRRYANRGRAARTGVDTRAGVPKRRTRWPGQHLACAVCGYDYVWGGHGQTDHLMCSGARGYACWCGATLDGGLAAERLAAALLNLAEGLPDFDEVLWGEFRAGLAAARSGSEAAIRKLAGEVERVGRAIRNVTASLERDGHSTALRARLRELEEEMAELAGEQCRLSEEPDDEVELPSRDEFVALVRQAVGRLAAGEPEFGRLMHRLIPRLEVFPVRLIDGGRVVLRARAWIDLASLLPGLAAECAPDLFRREVVVDLFERPQRAALMNRVVELRGRGLTERQAAAELGLTVTAAQRAMALYREMARRGLDDPYVIVTEPPDDGGGNMRRHLHPRYQFQPKPGYPSWPGAEAA